MTEDWLGRWREGRIGWHEPGGSAALQRHWPAQPAGGTVLVPLCGKSDDLKWLADRGQPVVGVELSELAILAFLETHRLAFERRAEGVFEVFRATGAAITLYSGDYFEFDHARCDALFDRGALVAVPPAERPRYVEHTNALLSPAATRLVVTLEYDQERAPGPPYSVPPGELQGYWPDLKLVERRNDIANAPPKFRDAGLDAFHEAVWLSSRL